MFFSKYFANEAQQDVDFDEDDEFSAAQSMQIAHEWANSIRDKLKSSHVATSADFRSQTIKERRQAGQPERKGYMYLGKRVPYSEELREQLAHRFFEFLSLQKVEGSITSINTYDDQMFTLGLGFSAKGQLPKVWRKLVASDPEIVDELKQKIDLTINSDGSVKYRGVKNNQAYDLLRDQLDDLVKLVNVLESDKHIQKLLDAEIAVIDDNLLKDLPDYVEKWSLTARLIVLHMGHWLQSLRVQTNTNDFRKCRNTLDVILTCYSLLADSPYNRKYNRLRAYPATYDGLYNSAWTVPYSYGVRRILSWIGGEELLKVFIKQGKRVTLENRNDRTMAQYKGKLCFQLESKKSNEFVCFDVKPVNNNVAPAATKKQFSIQNSPDKNHVIYDAVNSLNEYFKTNDMRSRYTLLASYLVTPNVDSHKFAAHLFSNMLNGALEACGLPLKSRFKTVFAQNMQIDMDTNQGLIGISGPILKARNTVWILQTSSGTDDFNQTAWWIDIIVGDTTYTFPVIASDADGHPYNPVVEAYKSFLYLILEKAYDNLIITRDDIRKSGVKL
ncbi:MAG: hypothetical protein MJZ34_02930 [Paludibacteraceae bacterium]|nr:hypothetical protein [Paludibacteraceae bacterium]